jgi:4-hydroxy-2-oxovalerate aldolase
MDARLGERAPPEIFDVTIRDGSYVIDFQFRPEDVRLLCQSLDRSGFRYIEVGHGLGLNASVVRDAAAAGDDEYLAAAAGACARARFGTFFIPGIGSYEHLRRARNTYGMHFVRIGAEPEKYEGMVPFLEYAKGLGYEVMCNFMKSYSAPAAELAGKAAVLARAGADAVYVVDSAGGMLPDEVGEYVRAMAEQTPARVGFHGHNNLELAVANSLSAWRNGAQLIDCSVGGLGRSSGNTRSELFIPVLKALGVEQPYDLEEILKLWQETILPLIRRRPVTAEEIVGGYARVHSGLVGPFVEASRRHGVSLASLLYAYGEALHRGRGVPPVEGLAAELARSVRAAAADRGGARTLLQVHAPVSDDQTIHNTFRSVAEVLRAVDVLSHKACLPVVAILDIAPVADEEPYFVAEYLYHDDHFIVLRAAFSSVSTFAEIMGKSRDWFDILVLDGKSPSVRAELAGLDPSWRQGATLLWADLTAVKYHCLFGALYQAVAETEATRVLFVGGDPQRLAEFAPPSLDGVEFLRTSPGADTVLGVGVRPLGRPARRTTVPDGPPPDTFDIAVVLSPVEGEELKALLGRLAPGATVLDCHGKAASTAGDLLRARGYAVVSVTLWKAMSGELLNLLCARNVKPAESKSGAPAADAEERHVGKTRAA